MTRNDQARKPVSFRLKADDATLLDNCLVEVAGRPVSITDAVITCAAGKESVVQITSYAQDGLDLEFPAEVQVSFVTLPGFVLTSEQSNLKPGLVRYTVKPEPAKADTLKELVLDVVPAATEDEYAEAGRIFTEIIDGRARIESGMVNTAAGMMSLDLLATMAQQWVDHVRASR